MRIIFANFSKLILPKEKFLENSNQSNPNQIKENIEDNNKTQLAGVKMVANASTEQLKNAFAAKSSSSLHAFQDENHSVPIFGSSKMNMTPTGMTFTTNS